MELSAELDIPPFLKVTENYQAIVNTAFRKYAEDTVANTKLWIAPHKSGLVNRTGKLRDSIRLSKFVQFSPHSGASATITAGSSRVPYASIHELGGTIKATRSKYLTFQVSGRWVKVEQVNIPARPYMKPAMQEMEPRFDGYLQDALDKIIGRL